MENRLVETRLQKIIDDKGKKYWRVFAMIDGYVLGKIDFKDYPTALETKQLLDFTSTHSLARYIGVDPADVSLVELLDNPAHISWVKR